MNYWKNIVMAILSAVLLSACSGDDADDLCEAPASTTGEPDITGSATFDTNPVNATAADVPVVVTVPIDADTGSVAVDFAKVGTTNMLGNPGFTDLTVATGDGTAGTAHSVNVTVTLQAAIVNQVAFGAGIYYPIIMLCDDNGTTCSSGVGYVEDLTDLISAANYVRGSSNGATVPTGTLTNSCVGITSVTVN